MIFSCLFYILDEETGDGNGGDSFSNVGDEDNFGEVLSNSANNSFEDCDEDVVVSESYEETQERLEEARRAQERLARERERQRRIRAAQRSVGFVEGADSDFNTTMNAGMDNDFTDHETMDNEVYIFPDDGTQRSVPRVPGPSSRPATASGLLRGAAASAINKRKDRGSTSSNATTDDGRRMRPRPLTTSQTFPRKDWPLGMTAEMVIDKLHSF